jgi:hypothetical protein
MANFAVIQDGLVVNILVADSVETAEQATGLTCVEYTDESPAVIGCSYNGEKFDNFPNAMVLSAPEQ